MGDLIYYSNYLCEFWTSPHGDDGYVGAWVLVESKLCASSSSSSSSSSSLLSSSRYSISFPFTSYCVHLQYYYLFYFLVEVLTSLSFWVLYLTLLLTLSRSHVNAFACNVLLSLWVFVLLNLSLSFLQWLSSLLADITLLCINTPWVLSTLFALSLSPSSLLLIFCSKLTFIFVSLHECVPNCFAVSYTYENNRVLRFIVGGKPNLQ